jgi:hypothetical protein
MFKALIRFILIIMPSAFLSGLAFIIFDKEEITGTVFNVRRQWRPNIKKRVLEKYLNDCYKHVHKEDAANEKRLDKD